MYIPPRLWMSLKSTYMGMPLKATYLDGIQIIIIINLYGAYILRNLSSEAQ